MSQLPALNDVPDRRRFLTFTIAAAAVAPISESALAQDRRDSTRMSESRSGAEKNARSRKTIQTATALRDLWLVTYSGCGMYRSRQSTKMIWRLRLMSSKRSQTLK